MRAKFPHSDFRQDFQLSCRFYFTNWPRFIPRATGQSWRGRGRGQRGRWQERREGISCRRHELRTAGFSLHHSIILLLCDVHSSNLIRGTVCRSQDYSCLSASRIDISTCHRRSANSGLTRNTCAMSPSIFQWLRQRNYRRRLVHFR